MILLLLNIFYLLILGLFIVASLFVAYHIVRYSLSSKESATMLLVFFSVLGVLLFFNLILFFSLDLERIFGSFMY
jgi:hypothetical protein